MQTLTWSILQNSICEHRTGKREVEESMAAAEVLVNPKVKYGMWE